MPDVVSAQVVLRPEVESSEFVRDYFRSLGFEVSEQFGTSFAITGPALTFSDALGAQAGTLTEDSLPAAVRDAVEAVAMPDPPDFGPRSYR